MEAGISGEAQNRQARAAHQRRASRSVVLRKTSKKTCFNLGLGHSKLPAPAQRKFLRRFFQ
jgi:hypothetical protein